MKWIRTSYQKLMGRLKWNTISAPATLCKRLIATNYSNHDELISVQFGQLVARQSKTVGNDGDRQVIAGVAKKMLFYWLRAMSAPHAMENGLNADDYKPSHRHAYAGDLHALLATQSKHFVPLMFSIRFCLFKVYTIGERLARCRQLLGKLFHATLRHSWGTTGQK